MIRRCYDLNKKELYSAYFGKCDVCEEWHNFQNFAKWYEDNFYQVGTERMHIDKDILFKDNRLYSPETCILVPQRINMLFMKKPNKAGLPTGIKKAGRGKYDAWYNEEFLGKYDALEDAVIAHDNKRKEAIKAVANEYKDVIPERLYVALINWTK